jgi:hypothetical protein
MNIGKRSQRHVVPTLVRVVAPGYDSGLVEVPDVLTPLTAITTRVATILIANGTTQLRHLTIKDGAGGFYWNDKAIQANETFPIRLDGMTFAAGITWRVRTGQNGLRVQIVGEQ